MVNPKVDNQSLGEGTCPLTKRRSENRFSSARSNGKIIMIARDVIDSTSLMISLDTTT
jgi:hypothetical protein